MKAFCKACVTALALVHAAGASAKEGDWVARLRATYVAPDAKSNISGLSGGLAPLNDSWLSPDSNTIPEFDISYYFTDHIAAELILATGSRHHVENKGNPSLGDLGSVNLLPPTLTVQWHFLPDQTIDPYVGIGINYTRFMDNNLSSGLAPNDIHTERNSFGPALQIGADYNLADGWLLNVDVKRVWIQTDVKLDGVGKIDSLHIDPWLVSVGFGKKF